MRILVFGAGVLGCNLAHCFYKSGKEVTLLARGKWAETIKRDGLTIVNKIPYYKTRDKINVIEQLDPDDQYDIIFVVARFSQLKDIIPVLNQNKTEHIVLVGNNTNAEEYEAQLPNKKVLFAFSSSAGHREENKVVSVNMSKITIGGTNKTTDYQTLINEVFAGMKYRVTFCDNMGDWLISHAAFILPVCFACYYTGGNLKKIKKDQAFINKVIDAMIEAYDAIRASGHEVLPEGSYEYVADRKKVTKFLKLCFGTFLGKIMASDHAMNAREEMRELNQNLLNQLDTSKSPMPNYLELSSYN